MGVSDFIRRPQPTPGTTEAKHDQKLSWETAPEPQPMHPRTSQENNLIYDQNKDRKRMEESPGKLCPQQNETGQEMFKTMARNGTKLH